MVSWRLAQFLSGKYAALRCPAWSHTEAECNRSGVCGPYGPAAPTDDPSGFSASWSQDATCPLSHVMRRSSRANYFITGERVCVRVRPNSSLEHKQV